MYIMNIRNNFNHCADFIFLLLIHNFMNKVVHILNNKCARISNIGALSVKERNFITKVTSQMV